MNSPTRNFDPDNLPEALLHAYLAGALAPEDARELDALFAESAAARAKLEDARVEYALIRDALRRGHAEPENVRLDDETLALYLDRALPEDERQAVEAALAASHVAQARLVALYREAQAASDDRVDYPSDDAPGGDVARETAPEYGEHKTPRVVPLPMPERRQANDKRELIYAALMLAGFVAAAAALMTAAPVQSVLLASSPPLLITGAALGAAASLRARRPAPPWRRASQYASGLLALLLLGASATSSSSRLVLISLASTGYAVWAIGWLEQKACEHLMRNALNADEAPKEITDTESQPAARDRSARI